MRFGGRALRDAISDAKVVVPRAVDAQIDYDGRWVPGLDPGTQSGKKCGRAPQGRRPQPTDRDRGVSVPVRELYDAKAIPYIARRPIWPLLEELPCARGGSPISPMTTPATGLFGAANSSLCARLDVSSPHAGAV